MCYLVLGERIDYIVIDSRGNFIVVNETMYKSLKKTYCVYGIESFYNSGVR
jgi:hypothetical protein